MPILNQDIFHLLKTLCDVFNKNQTRAYIVGGFIRDYFLNRENRDVDIAVKGSALEIAREVAIELTAKYVVLDKRNQVARVIINKGKKQIYLDFSSFSQSIKKDLSRRDFTVNSMAIKLANLDHGFKKIIDPYAGRNDLKRHIIKAINANVFKDDPSRLLRAVRFAHVLNFHIEPATEDHIRKDCNLISDVPGEKIREELLSILNMPNSYRAFCHMDNLKLLTLIIPELADLKGVEQPKEHYWDVFYHSLETVATIELLLRESKWRYNICHLLTYSSWTRDHIKHFNKRVSTSSSHKQLLKLSGLLHDIAKPTTKRIDEKGRIRFIGHANEGADIASGILRRLRFSKKEIKAVEILIQQHLRPAQLSNDRLPTRRAIYRFFRDTKGYGIDVLFLALADYLAARGANIELKNWKAVNSLCKYVVDEHLNQLCKSSVIKLVDGNDLLSTFKISPGPIIGRILAIIGEAHAAGEITTREAAIELAAKNIKQYHYKTHEKNTN